MRELPNDETRTRDAIAAIDQRERALVLVYQDADTGSFERGRELLMRWADGTSQVLSEQISEEEAQRFQDLTGMYTHDSLDEYFQEYQNYLEALLTTLRDNPKQFLPDRPRRAATAAPTPIPDAYPLPYDRLQQWWKSKWLLVVGAFAFAIIVSLASGIKQVSDVIHVFVPPLSAPAASPPPPAKADIRQPSISSSASKTDGPLVRSPSSGSSVDPVVDIQIGTPFGSTTLISLINSGTEGVENISVNLRCFLLTGPDDNHPTLLFDGFSSIDNAHSWWLIKSLALGKQRRRKQSMPHNVMYATNTYLRQTPVLDPHTGK